MFQVNQHQPPTFNSYFTLFLELYLQQFNQNQNQYDHSFTIDHTFYVFCYLLFLSFCCISTFYGQFCPWLSLLGYCQLEWGRNNSGRMPWLDCWYFISFNHAFLFVYNRVSIFAILFVLSLYQMVAFLRIINRKADLDE